MRLLLDVQRFLRTTGMPVTLFGRRAMNDPRFVLDLRGGRIPRRETARRVQVFILLNQDCHHGQ